MDRFTLDGTITVQFNGKTLSIDGSEFESNTETRNLGDGFIQDETLFVYHAPDAAFEILVSAVDTVVDSVTVRGAKRVNAEVRVMETDPKEDEEV